MMFSENLIQDLMRTVRGKSQVTKLDVTDLAEACVVDLSLVGVYVTDPEEPLCKQALKLYCKGHYGYDKDQETFRAAYAALCKRVLISSLCKTGGFSKFLTKKARKAVDKELLNDHL